jgi:anti-sigma regulatory factor (Ser/Thr protein kinase)
MALDEQLVSLTFFCRASRLKLLRCVIRDAAELVGLDEDATDAVVLAVNEACMNIMQHAYGMDPRGQIEVVISQEKDAMVFRLRDYAKPINTDAVEPRDLDDIRPGGLGVHFIRSLMDECGFLDTPEGGGNLFEMKKLINRKGDQNGVSG